MKENVMLGIILLVFSFVCAVLASWGVPAGRWSLGWGAFAFYIASLLFGSAAHLLH